MRVTKKDLYLDIRDEKRGYVIQNLQQSKAFEGQCIKDIVIQSINPSEDRGYHAHVSKTEWFMALSGEAKLITSEKMDKTNPDDLEVETLKADCLKPSYLLLIPPKLAHWIINDSEEVFVMASFSSLEFKKEDNIEYKEEQPFWRQKSMELLEKKQKNT